MNKPAMDISPFFGKDSKLEKIWFEITAQTMVYGQCVIEVTADEHSDVNLRLITPNEIYK